jgi:hypothetical protein
LPIYIDVKKDNLQLNPVAYDYEHKKRQVWSIFEIKTFLSVLSELPKFAWSACQRLPNKNSKEILFFH